MTRLLPLLLLVNSCAALSWLPSPCPVDYADPAYATPGVGDITRIPIPTLHRSPGGIPIGPGVDGALVDRVFKEVATCLGVSFIACGVHAVIIAPDVTVKENVFHIPEQVFPCSVNTLYCPGVNQYPATIIVTPDHHALRWEVERMLARKTPSKCQS